MNQSQEKIIAEMGIGPVWKLRLNPIDQGVTVLNVRAMKVQSEPSDQIDFSERVDSNINSNSLKNNAICQTCGWSLINLSDVQVAQTTGPNYLFIYECLVDIDSAQILGLSSSGEQLLSNILRALGIKIGVNGHVRSIVKTKPVKVGSHQLNGQKNDTCVCLSCLKQQINLIRPTVIISLGSLASISLLAFDSNEASGSLRGKLHRYDGIPLIVTNELSYLLQQPKEKRDLWSDLCLAMNAT